MAENESERGKCTAVVPPHAGRKVGLGRLWSFLGLPQVQGDSAIKLVPMLVHETAVNRREITEITGVE